VNWRGAAKIGWAFLVTVVAAAVAIALFDVAGRTPETAGHHVLNRLAESGVTNPVTAVLLNFRIYDTFLELLVLTAAFWGCWSLRARTATDLLRQPGLLLGRVVSIIIPSLLVLAIYLLWAGSSRPGGEFQAGAVLGAAGILVLLVGWAIPGARHRLLRDGVVVVGAGSFLVVSLIGWVLTGHVFSVFQGLEKPTMLVIEVAAALSIAFILIALFAGSADQLVATPGPEDEQGGDDGH
jgi:multisubunit Na+/H+ antiporter MnhB subunit